MLVTVVGGGPLDERRCGDILNVLVVGRAGFALAAMRTEASLDDLHGEESVRQTVKRIALLLGDLRVHAVEVQTLQDVLEAPGSKRKMIINKRFIENY